MTMLANISWRNVWRHRARSIVILCSVSLGMWAGMFIMSFYYGFVDERVSTSIRTEISHIQIHHPRFSADKEVKYAIANADSVMRVARASVPVQSIAPRLIMRAMIGAAAGSSGVDVKGVDPVDEDSLTLLHTFVKEGSYFPRTKKNEILIGKKLALKLKTKIGSKVVVTVQDSNGDITSGAFRVVGIFQTRSIPYDEANVYVVRTDLAAMIGDSSAVTEIAMLLRSQDSVVAATARLKQVLPALLVQDWRMISPEMDLIISMIDQLMYIFMGIMLLATAFGIVNTMLMAVLERTHEIGMLIALGMRRRRVFFMIVLETLFLVLAGSPFGFLLAFGSITYFGEHGIDLSFFRAVMSQFGYQQIVYTKLAPQHYVQVLILVSVTALLSALLPARRALKLQPAEALRT